MKPSNCIFCKIARKEIKVEILKESENFIAFPDANPKAEGHTLVIPKKHFVTLLDIPNNKGDELIKMVKDISSDLLDSKKADGFNILMNNLTPAGQVVFHAHINIIPRKEGDGIRTIS